MHTHRFYRFLTVSPAAGRIRRAPLVEVVGIGLATSATGNNLKINEVDVGGRLVAPTAK